MNESTHTADGISTRDSTSLTNADRLLSRLTLLCWEDPRLAYAVAHNAESAIVDLFDSGKLSAEDLTELARKAAQIGPSPIHKEDASSKPRLLAFWDGVFELTEPEPVAEEPGRSPVDIPSSSARPSQPDCQACELSMDQLHSLLSRKGNRQNSSYQTSTPFSCLLEPLVEHASNVLAKLTDPHSWLKGALPGLAQQLRDRLNSIAALPLYLWFHLHRQPQDPKPLQSFCASMQDGLDDAESPAGPCWSGLLLEYPELARLLLLLHAQWIQASEEFLRRTIADRDRLRDLLDVAEIVVESTVAGISDYHHQGRCVIQVVFAGGQRLAYKPRSLAPEAAFGRLLAEFSHDCISLPFAKVLTSSTHGWMSWINQAELDTGTPLNASEWYSAAGQLLALLHLLGVRDAHMANCIATTTGPALVDFECLMTPDKLTSRAHLSEGSEKDVPAWLAEITSTSFLPDLMGGTSNPDCSGLFGHGGQQAGCQIPYWTESGPGMVRIAFKDAVLREQANRFVPAAEPQSKMLVRQPFLAGFAAMHRHLSAHAADVLRELEPLRLHPVRILPRNTRRYTQILSDSIHPRLLRDSEDRRRSIVDILKKERPSLLLQSDAALIEEESRALADLDIPFIYAVGRDLFSASGLLHDGVFSTSGFEACEQRLRSLPLEPDQSVIQALNLIWLSSL